MLKTPIKAVYLDGDSLMLEETVLDPLKALFTDWHRYPSTTTSEEAIARLQGAQVAICNKSAITKEVIAACPDLKLILVTATGTNNVDLIATKSKGITVCNCQGYSIQAVTQHTMMLILALAGHLLDYHQAVNKGEWQQANNFCLIQFPILALTGKTLGIIGYGDLGQGVAKLAQAFGMNILIGQLPNRPIKDNYLPLEQLLPKVDVLSLHCPLTEDTFNLLTETELQLMKPNALLVNTARGGIINEADLVKVLRSGHLGGAATDVLTVEPPKQGNPLLEPNIPRLIITPHCAWSTYEARIRIVNQVIENSKAFLAGKPIRIVS